VINIFHKYKLLKFFQSDGSSFAAVRARVGFGARTAKDTKERIKKCLLFRRPAL